MKDWQKRLKDHSSNSRIQASPTVDHHSDLSRLHSWFVLITGCSIICFLLCWSTVNLLAGHHVWLSLLSLALFAGMVPSIMEDAGWYLAQRLRLYDAGRALIFAAHQLDCTVFGLVRGQTHSMNAMRLAQVALLRNRVDEALNWGDKALTMSKRDIWFGKFYANCVMGQIHYSTQNWREAAVYLKRAQALFDENINRAQLSMLKDKLRRFDAVNLDLLGRVALLNGEIEDARELFDKSYALRIQLADRKPLAEAFLEHSRGLIAFQEFNIGQAHKSFSKALDLLPNSICADYEEQTLAVEICNDAVAYGHDSDEVAIKSADKLGQLQSRGLPPRLLELAAKPIPLFKETP